MESKETKEEDYWCLICRGKSLKFSALSFYFYIWNWRTGSVSWGIDLALVSILYKTDGGTWSCPGNTGFRHLNSVFRSDIDHFIRRRFIILCWELSFFSPRFHWGFVTKATNHSLKPRSVSLQCMPDPGDSEWDAHAPSVDSGPRSSYHTAYTRIADLRLSWLSFRFSFMSLFCLTVVVSDIWKTSTTPIKDNVIIYPTTPIFPCGG